MFMKDKYYIISFKMYFLLILISRNKLALISRDSQLCYTVASQLSENKDKDTSLGVPRMCFVPMCSTVC